MLKRIFPILDWLPNYKTSYLSGDVTAGLTVGIMLIPQGMAYAMIAGLPPVFGLYAALLPQVVYAIMGTSRQLAVGPVAMDSLLVASGLGALALSGIEEYISMAIFLALFMGTIQFALGFLRMGFLVNYLSKPVISGFTSAAAIIIGLSQLKHLLGTEIPSSSHIHTLIQNTIETLGTTNLITLGIGIIAIILIKVLRKVHKQIPGGLIAVMLGIGFVYFLNLESFDVKIVGSIPEGLPGFNIPTLEWSRVSELFPIAMTLALIAFMEAISVAKAVEERHDDYEVNANKELIALGSSNIIGSLFQSYPTTGGFSRTAVNDQAGAKTGLAAVISALIVGLTLLFLTPLFYYLPNAILAAVVMVAVFGLIDINYPKQLFKYRKDEFYLLLFTFTITLFVGIKEGILLGVLVSLLLLVYRTSKPHIAILGKISGTDYFRNIHRFEEAEIDNDLLILRFDAQIYFGNKDYFKQAVLKEIKTKGKGLKWVILNAEAINYIDSSAAHMLKQLLKELNENGITLVIAGATGPTRDILFSSRLVDDIGKDNLYVSTLEAYRSIKHETTIEPVHKQISLQNKM
ncbi:SulP family inorganic anion transporter [Aegicerativicinus sediminis]